MNRFILISSFFVLGIASSGLAQPLAHVDSHQKFKIWQDSLKKWSHQILHNQIESERYNANYAFIKTLVHVLKIPGSFHYDFDSLKTISISPSGDSHFRLFTWHVHNTDGSYRYYGTIQMNNSDGQLKLFPLIDYTPSFRNPADTITTNDRWYGAQYYKIIPVNGPHKPYYILLGWKGNTHQSTKKVIDILSFKDGKAHFGMAVFDGYQNDANKKRIIFEYASNVSMLLRYLPEESTIVFDHLAPMNEKMADKPECHGPDMSYDGFKLVNHRCVFVEDMPLKNLPSHTDQHKINKKKHSTKKIPRSLKS